MPTIQIPVNVLDERCATCQCLSLQKDDLYINLDHFVTQFTCEHLHMCQYIKNRIVRKEENKNDGTNNP